MLKIQSNAGPSPITTNISNILEGSSFPYLEGIKETLAAKRENTTAQGTNGAAERIEKEKHEISYLETLTERKTKRNHGDEYG